MNRDQARNKAEEIVFVYCTLGDILYRCEIAGIPTYTRNGRRRSRTDLENELIEHYTNNYSKDEKK